MKAIEGRVYRLKIEGPSYGQADLLSELNVRLLGQTEPRIIIHSFARNHSGSVGRADTFATVSFTGDLTGALADLHRYIQGSQNILSIDDEFEGLTTLYAPDNPLDDLVDIVFLPGLGGHSLTTFWHGKEYTTFIWHRDLLGEECKHARVLTWGYQGPLMRSISFQDLWTIGLNLRAALLLLDHRPESTRPLILAGVNLGGLVIQKAIVELHRADESNNDLDSGRLINRITHLFMFGVPKQGMAVQHLDSILQDKAPQELVRSLGPNSPELRTLRSDFAVAFPSPHSKIYSLFETLESPVLVERGGKLVPSGKTVRLVNEQSATHGRYQFESGQACVLPISKNNRDIARFAHGEDNLEIVLEKFKQAVNEAQSIVLRHFSVQRSVAHNTDSSPFSHKTSYHKTGPARIMSAEYPPSSQVGRGSLAHSRKSIYPDADRDIREHVTETSRDTTGDSFAVTSRLKSRVT